MSSDKPSRIRQSDSCLKVQVPRPWLDKKKLSVYIQPIQGSWVHCLNLQVLYSAICFKYYKVNIEFYQYQIKKFRTKRRMVRRYLRYVEHNPDKNQERIEVKQIKKKLTWEGVGRFLNLASSMF